MCGTIGTVNGRDNVAAMIGTFIAALPDLKATEPSGAWTQAAALAFLDDVGAKPPAPGPW
jgi:hypothetical protein